MASGASLLHLLSRALNRMQKRWVPLAAIPVGIVVVERNNKCHSTPVLEQEHVLRFGGLDDFRSRCLLIQGQGLHGGSWAVVSVFLRTRSTSTVRFAS